MGPLHRRLFGHVRSSGACTSRTSLTRPTDHFQDTLARGRPIRRSDRVSETLAADYHHQQRGRCILTADTSLFGFGGQECRSNTGGPRIAPVRITVSAASGGSCTAAPFVYPGATVTVVYIPLA